MTKYKIIIAGEWEEGCDLLTSCLKGLNHEAEIVALGDAKAELKKKSVDVLIYCVKGAGEEILVRIKELRRINDAVPLFLFVKNVDVGFVVQSLKLLVTDVLVRPLDKNALQEKIEREVHLYQLTKKIFVTSSAVTENCYENMIGSSKPMQDNFAMVAAVAKSNATVLITGESGVGKELVARAIHRRSPRANQKFVDLNCGAIPKELLENELFGHEKGSFTGAHRRYLGSFEVAHQGILFLDEICEMDLHLQVKLLRVLQERSFTRVGGNDNITVDIKVIAATNRDIQQMVEKGKFREDLYYRLNVVNIHIPPLRERREDIPLLARHFLEYHAAKNNRIFLDFATDAMEALINYDWPGNVRELENTIERIIVLNDASEIKLKHLPTHLQKIERAIGFSEEALLMNESRVVPLMDLERRAIEAALLKFQGNVSVAAKKLKIGQATLYRKVKKFKLKYD